MFDRDRSRLEEPAQVGGQVGDRRFEEHPATGLVHVAQMCQQRRARFRRRIRKQRPKCGVGVDALRADNRCGFGKEPRLRRVAANGRNGGEVVERLGQTGRCGGAGSLGCDR